MKGRKPSEACLAAVRRRLQDISEGRIPHPYKVMRTNEPERWRQMIEKMSNGRKELVRKEKLRVVYGLEQKTNIVIVMCRYKDSQRRRRHSARKRGYIVPDECSEMGSTRYVIYYDDDTRRSRVFERNLIRDGFKVLPYYEQDIRFEKTVH